MLKKKKIKWKISTFGNIFVEKNYFTLFEFISKYKIIWNLFFIIFIPNIPIFIGKKKNGKKN